MNSLKKAPGLILPKRVEGDLNLGITLGNDVIFPEYVEGDIHLENLKSVTGLTLPKHVGGNVYFDQISSTVNLIRPEFIGGSIGCASMSGIESCDQREVLLPEYKTDN